MENTTVFDFLKFGSINRILHAGASIITPDVIKELTYSTTIDIFNYYEDDCFTLCLQGNVLLDVHLYLKYYPKSYTGIKLRYGADFYSVIAKLAAAGINWQFDKKYTYDSDLCLLTEGGVNISFRKTEKIWLQEIALYMPN